MNLATLELMLETETSPAWQAPLPKWNSPQGEPHQQLLPSSAFHHPPLRGTAPHVNKTSLQLSTAVLLGQEDHLHGRCDG